MDVPEVHIQLYSPGTHKNIHKNLQYILKEMMRVDEDLPPGILTILDTIKDLNVPAESMRFIVEQLGWSAARIYATTKIGVSDSSTLVKKVKDILISTPPLQQPGAGQGVAMVSGDGGVAEEGPTFDINVIPESYIVKKFYELLEKPLAIGASAHKRDRITDYELTEIQTVFDQILDQTFMNIQPGFEGFERVRNKVKGLGTQQWNMLRAGWIKMYDIVTRGCTHHHQPGMSLDVTNIPVHMLPIVYTNDTTKVLPRAPNLTAAVDTTRFKPMPSSEDDATLMTHDGTKIGGPSSVKLVLFRDTDDDDYMNELYTYIPPPPPSATISLELFVPVNENWINFHVKKMTYYVISVTLGRHTYCTSNRTVVTPSHPIPANSAKTDFGNLVDLDATPNIIEYWSKELHMVVNPNDTVLKLFSKFLRDQPFAANSNKGIFAEIFCEVCDHPTTTTDIQKKMLCFLYLLMCAKSLGDSTHGILQVISESPIDTTGFGPRGRRGTFQINWKHIGKRWATWTHDWAVVGRGLLGGPKEGNPIGSVGENFLLTSNNSFREEGPVADIKQLVRENILKIQSTLEFLNVMSYHCRNVCAAIANSEREVDGDSKVTYVITIPPHLKQKFKSEIESLAGGPAGDLKDWINRCCGLYHNLPFNNSKDINKLDYFVEKAKILFTTLLDVHNDILDGLQDTSAEERTDEYLESKKHTVIQLIPTCNMVISKLITFDTTIETHLNPIRTHFTEWAESNNPRIRRNPSLTEFLTQPGRDKTFNSLMNVPQSTQFTAPAEATTFCKPVYIFAATDCSNANNDENRQIDLQCIELLKVMLKHDAKLAVLSKKILGEVIALMVAADLYNHTPWAQRLEIKSQGDNDNVRQKIFTLKMPGVDIQRRVVKNVYKKTDLIFSFKTLTPELFSKWITWWRNRKSSADRHPSKRRKVLLGSGSSTGVGREVSMDSLRDSAVAPRDPLLPGWLEELFMKEQVTLDEAIVKIEEKENDMMSHTLNNIRLDRMMVVSLSLIDGTLEELGLYTYKLADIVSKHGESRDAAPSSLSGKSEEAAEEILLEDQGKYIIQKFVEFTLKRMAIHSVDDEVLRKAASSAEDADEIVSFFSKLALEEEDGDDFDFSNEVIDRIEDNFSRNMRSIVDKVWSYFTTVPEIGAPPMMPPFLQYLTEGRVASAAIDIREVPALLDKGTIVGATRVWTEGMDDWMVWEEAAPKFGFGHDGPIFEEFLYYGLPEWDEQPPQVQGQQVQGHGPTELHFDPSAGAEGEPLLGVGSKDSAPSTPPSSSPNRLATAIAAMARRLPGSTRGGKSKRKRRKKKQTARASRHVTRHSKNKTRRKGGRKRSKITRKKRKSRSKRSN